MAQTIVKSQTRLEPFSVSHGGRTESTATLKDNSDFLRSQLAGFITSGIMPPKQRQVSGKQTSASQQQQQHAQATSTTAGTSDTVTAEPTTSIGAVSASYGHKGSRGTADAGAGFGGALQQLWTNYVDQSELSTTTTTCGQSRVITLAQD